MPMPTREFKVAFVLAVLSRVVPQVKNEHHFDDLLLLDDTHKSLELEGSCSSSDTVTVVSDPC